MITYYLLFSILFLIAISGFQKAKIKKKLYCMGIIMTLFQGLRWNTGADWTQFYTICEQINWSNFYNFDRGGYRTIEIGYAFLNTIVKFLIPKYTIFLLLTCGFINYSYIRFVIHHIPKYQTICLFMILVCSSLFPVRNVLAGIFIIYGINYIINKQIIQYSCITILSSLIHSSGLFCLFLYWSDKYINKYIIISLYLFSTVISNYFTIIIDKIGSLPYINKIEIFQMASAYNEIHNIYGRNIDTFSITSFLINGIILFIILLYRDKQHDINKELCNILTNMTSLMLIFTQLARDSNVIGEFSRISYFTSIGFPTLFVLTFMYFFHDVYKVKYIVPISLIVLYSLNKINGYKNDIYSNLYIPYYSVFEDSKVRDYFIQF